MPNNGQGPPADLFSEGEIKGQIQLQPTAQPAVQAGGWQPPANLFSEQEMQPPAPPMAEMRAVQEPTTWIGKFGRWAENVSNDLKYGTDHTGIGTVLKRMGAHGVYAGEPEAVGDFMASLPLGLLRATKGATQVTPQILGGPQGQTMRGLQNIGGGLLQAAQEPAAFMAPEEAEVAATGAGKATGAARQAGQAVKKAVTIPKEPAEVVSTVQPNLQARVTDMADQVAQEAGVQPAKGTMRQTYEKLSDAIEAKAKDLYDQVEAKAGKEFFNKRQEIDRLDREMKRVAGTETTETEINATSEMFAKKIVLDQQMAELIDKSGVDPAVADAAKINWQQKSALDDLDAAHKGAMPGHLQARGPQMGVNSWADRLERMRDSGRLQQALSQDPAQGGERADQMLNDAYQSIIEEEGTKAQQTAREEAIKRIEARKAERVKMAKQAAKWIAGPTIGGALFEGGRRMMTPSK